jgi:hypothetical protein
VHHCQVTIFLIVAGAMACVPLSGCASRQAVTLSPDLSATAVDGSAQRPLNSGAPATALIFIATDCPIANGYAPEIQRIVSEYTPRGVAFYLVHVDRQITATQAQTHATEYGYACPILLDRDHQLVSAVGATVTPEAAVIDRNREVVYRGRIDDRYTDFGKRRFEPSQRDLRAALDAVLEGRSVPRAHTRAIGCYIDTETGARLNAVRGD